MYSVRGGNSFGLGLTEGICLTVTLCLYAWWGLEGMIGTKEDTLAQWLMAIFGAVATALSAWAVVLLKQTLNQTEVATQSTQDAVAITARMARLQSQAYLTFSGSEVAYGSAEGLAAFFVVRPRFKNTGQSPGMIVYAFCHIMVVDDLTSSIDYRVDRVSEYRTKLNVGPGEERWISGPPLKVEDVARVVAEKKILLFLGCIEFTDIFDDVRRSEDFCFKIEFHGDPATRCGHNWNTHQDYKVHVI